MALVMINVCSKYMAMAFIFNNLFNAATSCLFTVGEDCMEKVCVLETNSIC